MRCERVKIGNDIEFVCGAAKPVGSTLGAGWPRSAKQLESAGFRDERKQKWCTCGAVLFWFTTANGNWIPLERTEGARFQPHHANCRDVKNFRTADRAYKKRVEGKKPEQLELLAGAKADRK